MLNNETENQASLSNRIKVPFVSGPSKKKLVKETISIVSSCDSDTGSFFAHISSVQ